MKKIKEKQKYFEILAIGLIIIFALSIAPKTLQNDTFYTVKIGELIIQNGIDMKDHFSWQTNSLGESLPYTYPHWLYDVGMQFIYSIGSWDAIYLSTCILSAILAVCIYKVNSRLNKNQIISFFITIGTMYLLKSYIAARAQLVTFILFILLVYNIERFLKTKKVINAIGLFLIQTLIANLHVAVWPFTFVLYMPYIGEYLISEIIELTLYKKINIYILKRRIKRIENKLIKNKDDKELKDIKEFLNRRLESLENKVEKIKEKRKENLENPYKIRIEKNLNARWLILIMLITILTGLLTPLGSVPYTYTYLTLEGNTTQYINEHLAMTIIDNVPVLCTIIIFLAFLIFTPAKIKLSDLFMIGGLAYLMLASRRQSSMFALIGSIVLARIITDSLSIYIKLSYKDMLKKFMNKFIIFVIVVIIAIMSFDFFSKKRYNPYISSNTYPVKASEWILENLDVNNIKLYNEYNYGSYLLYKGIPVFVDSRADLYAPEFNGDKDRGIEGQDIFSDFLNSSNIGNYYGEIFEKYGITHVIIYESSKLNMLIKNADSEKYNLIYSDDYFVIYEVLEY